MTLEETVNRTATPGKPKVFDINSKKSFGDLKAYFDYHSKASEKYRYRGPLVGQMTEAYIDEHGLNKTHWMNSLVWFIDQWAISRGKFNAQYRLAIVNNAIRMGEYAAKNGKFIVDSGHDDCVIVTISPFRGNRKDGEEWQKNGNLDSSG